MHPDLKRLLLISLIMFVFVASKAQDSISNNIDSIVHIDSLHLSSDSLSHPMRQRDTIKAVVTKSSGVPRQKDTRQLYFYIIAALFLFLGILKTAFGKYFNNMIRVFFNTSLRQMQLTDQLLIAQLPSLLFNIFFIMVGGTYLFLMIMHFHPVALNPYLLWAYAMLSVLSVYLVKYISIRFTGWVTGFSTDAGAYMFIVFLVNKMLALMLLPFIALIAFSNDFLKEWSTYTSLGIIILAMLLRYLRTFGLIREKHKLSFFHFLLYIIAIEVLPIMLVFHFGMEILNKNL